MTSSFSYTRWKALLFGGVATTIAAGILWVGVEAFDPYWTATVTKGQWLVNMPVVIRAPIFLVVAGLLLALGLWMIGAGLSGAEVVMFTPDGVEARTIFGRRRHLDWSDVAEIRHSKNRIGLSPAGIDTIGQRIWDRRSVLIDVGMLDATQAQIEALIEAHRPGLPIRML